MARSRTTYRCSSCGDESLKWAGRCPGCGEWNSLEEHAPPAAGNAAGLPPAVPELLGEVDLSAAAPASTGLTEFDRVLSGGFVPGSVTLLGGEPGVGKSTLLLQVLVAMAGGGAPVLLVAAEESARQVRLRASRLGDIPASLWVLAATDVAAVVEAVEVSRPALVVVDSIQAVADSTTTGPPGSLSQVRACAEVLVGMAKASGVPVVLVGHVTKDGALAGPRTLEHMVDTVLHVEGDRHHALRLVRAVKHRFGPTGELGLFEMGESGLAAVADPYRLLLGDRRPGEPGSAVLPAVEGQRALMVEVQALVGPADMPVPRRAAQGVDGGRLALLLAVLEQRAGVAFARSDVFASAVGGIKLAEPAADLALALSLCSAALGLALPPGVVAFGEIGLGGEIRQVPHAPRRLAEAARVGFRHALVPASCPDGPPGMELLHVRSVSQALSLAGLRPMADKVPEKQLT